MGTRARRKVREDDIFALTRLLTTMVENIVDDAEMVEVRCSNGATDIRLSAEVGDDDIRFLKGHHGTTRDALRRIMDSAGKARGVMVRVNFPQL